MGPLDKYRPVYSAPKDGGVEQPDSTLENLKAYGTSLQTYVKKRHELRDFRRKNEAVLTDPDVYKESLVMDREVNHAHEDVKDVGKKIGKNEYDIIVDILRQEGNLSGAFGLPEFCLLTTDDIFMGNAGEERFVPRGGTMPNRTKLDLHLKTGTHEDSRFFTKDDALIVFEVVLHEGKGMHMDEWVTYAPDSYSREHRMRTLAQTLGTDTMGFSDADPEYGFHAHSISLAGVIIRKKDIETTAALIRDNPQLYRLGKEFYTPEEIKKNDEQFEKNLIEAYESMSKYANYEQNAKRFLARIRQVYGAEHSAAAESIYKQWIISKRERDGY